MPKKLKSNMKVAHLNVSSLKSREHFQLVEDTVVQNGFDIFTINFLKHGLIHRLPTKVLRSLAIKSSGKIVGFSNQVGGCALMLKPA